MLTGFADRGFIGKIMVLIENAVYLVERIGCFCSKFFQRRTPQHPIQIIIRQIPAFTEKLRIVFVTNPVVRSDNPGVIIGVQSEPMPNLLQIGKTLDASCLFPCLIQRRQQHRRKNGDDRDHNEQFNESEYPRSSATPESGDSGIRRSCGENGGQMQTDHHELHC